MTEKEKKQEEEQKDLDPNYYPLNPLYVPSYEEDTLTLDDNLVPAPEPAPEEKKNKQRPRTSQQAKTKQKQMKTQENMWMKIQTQITFT